MMMDIKTAITHDGMFHADDVLATALLKLIYPNIQVIRTRNESKFSEVDLVYDVGFGKYDHHDDNEEYPNGVRMAAVGKIFRDFHPYIISKFGIDPGDEDYDEIRDVMLRDIFYAVEAQDNGQESDYTHLFTWVNCMNSIDIYDNEDAFNLSVNMASTIFENATKKIIYTIKSKTAVLKALTTSSSYVGERSVYLGDYKPWVGTVLEYNRDLPESDKVACVLWKSNETDYKVQCVTVAAKTFKTYVLAPAAWRGTKNDDFVKISGLETGTFCHKDGFICGFRTYDDAVAAAAIIETCVCD